MLNKAQNGQKWFNKDISKLLNISEVLSLRNLIKINKIKYANKGPAYYCPQTVRKQLYYPSSKQCINVLCIDGYFFDLIEYCQK